MQGLESSGPDVASGEGWHGNSRVAVVGDGNGPGASGRWCPLFVGKITFASHFMMNGGNLLTLQKILGHQSIQMTMRYAHLSPDHLSEAVQFAPSPGRT